MLPSPLASGSQSVLSGHVLKPVTDECSGAPAPTARIQTSGVGPAVSTVSSPVNPGFALEPPGQSLKSTSTQAPHQDCPVLSSGAGCGCRVLLKYLLHPEPGRKGPTASPNRRSCCPHQLHPPATDPSQRHVPNLFSSWDIERWISRCLGELNRLPQTPQASRIRPGPITSHVPIPLQASSAMATAPPPHFIS